MIPFVSDAAAIGAGAVCGALCRYQVGRYAADRIASNPKRWGAYSGWHTAGINVLGSFCLGAVAGSPVVQPTTGQQISTTALPKVMPSGLMTPRAKLLLGIGFCGSFTTFSTYSVDIVTWIAGGQVKKALSYAMVNNVGSVSAAAAGMILVKRICK